MLSLPDYRFTDPDIQRLTDWAELACLLDPSGEVSDGDLADVLHDSLLLDKDDHSDITEWERAEMLGGEILTSIGTRSKVLGPGYPFQRAAKSFQLRGSANGYICYTTLLAADIGRFYRAVPSISANPFTFLFEKVVEAALSTLFGGAAYRFGWPLEAGGPTGIVARLSRLATAMELELDEPQKKTRGADKDLGLDVACRLRTGDEGPGTGVIVTQCATGENWSSKTAEPSVERWAKLLYWNSHLIRAIAFPWRQDDPAKIRILSNHYPGLIFDRMRLLCGQNPDARIDKTTTRALVRWSGRRIEQIQNRRRAGRYTKRQVRHVVSARKLRR